MFINSLLVVLMVGSCFAAKPVVFRAGDREERIPIEIPIDDPLIIELLELFFDDENSSGMIQAANAIVIGLSALAGEATPQLGIGQLKLRLEIDLPYADLQQGSYYTNASFIAAEGPLVFAGAGNVRGNLHELRAVINANITSFATTTITGLTIEPTFTHATVFCENLSLNGEVINWEEVNENFKQIFDDFWAANQATITETVRLVASDVVAGCSLLDLIGIISGGSTECLTFPTHKRI